MKTAFKRLTSVLLIAALLLSVASFDAFAVSVSYGRIISAATRIIIRNEGEYNTVVRNDNGALSIGVIGWHATNALNLLKNIVAKNPTQAHSILGASLYNEVITKTYWETRIPTQAEASVISVLISTSEGVEVQNNTAYQYISGYVTHGQNLGITEPEGLVFFADYQNQNGYTGAQNFFYSVKASYGSVNLGTLYQGSSKNARRTRTYNFCASINWNDYSDNPSFSADTKAPEIADVAVTGLTSSGFSVSCSVSDNKKVSTVYFSVYYVNSGVDSSIWYSQTPTDGKASHTVNISEFSNLAGAYRVFIYAFDEDGNYAYVELNDIVVPEKVQEKPKLSLSVYSGSAIAEKGTTIKWSAGASGGSGNYQYKFELYKDDILIQTRNFLDYSDFSYTADTEGVYNVKVSAVDMSAMLAAIADSLPTVICTPIEIKSFGSSKTAAMLGEQLSFHADVSGGTGNLSYSYTVYADGVAVASNSFVSSTEFFYKPVEGGTYSVTLTVMDSAGQVKSVKSGDIIVVSPLSAGDVTFSRSYAIVGSMVSCDVKVSGGTGNYTCVFSIYCNGKLVDTSGTVASDSYGFTVPSDGEYTATVTVTDADMSETTVSGGKLTAALTALQGDSNADGILSAADARLALRYSAKLDEIFPEFIAVTDVNSDGSITASDARIILRVSALLQTF